MNRRNFLAFLPSISAIPLIGKDIIEKSDRIEIIQPEQMTEEIKKSSQQFSLWDCEVHVVSRQTGEVIGKGYLTELNMSSDFIDVASRNDAGVSDGFAQKISGARRITIAAQLETLSHR